MPIKTREEQRNNSRKNEEAEPKQEGHPVVEMSNGESKAKCYKKQCCIGNWNVRSMNQVVKQKMARVNITILGISELKWTRMGTFNSDDDYIYYCGKDSLRRNEVALIVNKRVQNAVLGCNLKKDRIIWVCLQGKPFNNTVIQVYAPTTNAEEDQVEYLCEDI